MAPQNSTLLHENFESSSELGRFSPIFPLNEKRRNDEVLRQSKSIVTTKEVQMEVNFRQFKIISKYLQLLLF